VAFQTPFPCLDPTLASCPNFRVHLYSINGYSYYTSEHYPFFGEGFDSFASHIAYVEAPPMSLNDRRARDVGGTLCDPRRPGAHPLGQNGPEFTAALVRRWLEALDVETLFIAPGSPWENGYVEYFNGKLRDELLDRGIFFTLAEAQILIERWRREYNTVRPHSALGYRPPAPEAIMPATLGSVEMSPALS